MKGLKPEIEKILLENKWFIYNIYLILNKKIINIINYGKNGKITKTSNFLSEILKFIELNIKY